MMPQVNSTCNSKDDFAIILSTLDSFIALVALLGNSLIVFVFYRYRHLRTPTNMFVVAIASSDMLTALTIPYYVSFYFQVPYKCNKLACALRYLLTLYSTILSLVLMIGLAIDRYLAVLHPLYYVSIVQRGRVRSVITLSAVYIAFMCGVPLADVHLYKTNNDNDTSYVECDLYYIADVPYTLLAVCFPVALAVVVTSLLYWRIYKEALRHSRNSPMVFHKKWETNMAIMMFLILGVHVVSLIPYLTVVTMRHFIPSQWQPTFSVIKKFCTVLYFAQSCVNPFICALRNKGFRMAFRHTLGCGISMPRSNDFSPAPSNGSNKPPVEPIF